MAIATILFFIILISLWILGYYYLHFQTMVRNKYEKYLSMEKKYKQRKSYLESAKQSHQKNVENLQSQVQDLKERLQELKR